MADHKDTMEYGSFIAKKRSKVVHLWTGYDTLCRLYSTDPRTNKDEWEFWTNNQGRPICSMCGNVAIRDRVPV